MRPALVRAVHAYARLQRPRGPVAVVLGYHRVTDGAGDLAVGVRTFDEHMRALAELREELPTLALTECLNRLEDGSAPARSVVVTFDDAWADFHEHALEILVAHQIPATLYVPSAWVGSPGYVSYTQLAELLAEGIDIGAHTRTHPDLRTCSDAELELEIAGSREELEQLIGARVDSFAYPTGLFDHRVVAAVARAGFRSAVTTRRGWLRPGSDLLRIRRSFVEDFPARTFVAAARGGMNVLAAPDAIMAALGGLAGGSSEGRLPA